MKIIAFYLPQFHSFKENDEWWGKGFTEWDNVKKALPLYKGHLQPQIPYRNNYYNLLDANTLKQQADLANNFGIYGFCFYHYWFNDYPLMEKPLEILHSHKEINLRFCISWANEDWTRAWAQKSNEVLISQEYGGKEEWRRHFKYIVQFFKDERYIKINGKPLIIIYRPELIDCLEEMIQEWKKLAIENGFEGITLAYQRASRFNHIKHIYGHIFDYGIEYQPELVHMQQEKCLKIKVRRLLNLITCRLSLPTNKLNVIAYNYDDTWKRILNLTPRDEKMFPGAFVNWDNTPRHGKRGTLELGYETEKFECYFRQQIINARVKYKKDYVFLFAWNEWGEGGFIEPSEQEGLRRLTAIKNALMECNEFDTK